MEDIRQLDAELQARTLVLGEQTMTIRRQQELISQLQERIKSLEETADPEVIAHE